VNDGYAHYALTCSRATAEVLAREGARALISGRSEARGAEVVAAIEAAGGEAEFVRADLESHDDMRALAERAADVDILVNKAGVFPVGATSFRRRRLTRRSPSTSRLRFCSPRRSHRRWSRAAAARSST
jgi:NAD(P)-dependent dehydrogenase (short-subunit alcohol dehydrogenase family)